MINLFRSHNPLNIVFLFVITFAMRLAFFIHVPSQLNFEFLEPYTKFFLSVPDGAILSPTGNVLVAGFLLFIQALYFNRVINNHGLMERPSYLAGLLFIISSSLFLPFMIISPPLICNFLLIWLIDNLLKLGKINSAMATLYNSGILIAIGTLIYFPFIIMLLMLWLSLVMSRPFSWREWIIGLLGFFTIFFFLGVWYYWNDRIDLIYNIWLPLTTKFPAVFKINYSDYASLMPLLLILVLAVIQLRQKYFTSFISTRKAFQILFFMFLLALSSFYMKPDFRIYHFLLCVPSGAVLLAYYFSNAKIRWLYESLFLLLIVCIQYFLFV